MPELWEFVSDYSELYKVSNLGRVRSLHGKGRFLKFDIGERGHCRVTLSLEGITKRFLVHHLVLSHFVGERPDGMQGSHINGRPRDNRRKNLIWESPEDNNRRKVGHGTHQVGERNGLSKLTWDDVTEIREIGPTMFQRDIAKLFGVNQRAIWSVLNDKTWKEETRPGA